MCPPKVDVLIFLCGKTYSLFIGRGIFNRILYNNIFIYGFLEIIIMNMMLILKQKLETTKGIHIYLCNDF